MIVDLGEGTPYYISRREGGVSASGVVLRPPEPIAEFRCGSIIFFSTEMR